MKSTSLEAASVEAASNAILTLSYNEKGKPVTRSIYPLRFTPENLERLWIVAKPFKTIFGHEHDGDFTKFVSFFLSMEDNPEGGLAPAKARGLFWVVDDFLGLFFITDITPGIDASVHFTFFDRAFERRRPLIKAALAYGFNHYDLHRFSTEVPLYVNANVVRNEDGSIKLDDNGKQVQKFNAFKAVESLGFRQEGRRREVRLFDGKYFDVKIYGLLRSEFEKQNGL